MPHKPRPHKPRPAAPDGRPSAAARGYDAAWRRLRVVKLQRDPVCEECKRAAARHVDHVVSLERGGPRLDLANLRSLCHSCHSVKTCSVDRGFGRKPKDN